MPESGIILGFVVSALIPVGVWNSAANALMAKWLFRSFFDVDLSIPRERFRMCGLAFEGCYRVSWGGCHLLSIVQVFG